MKSKIFTLSTKKYGYKIKLKIEINENEIKTSWLHDYENNIKFTNERIFNVLELNFAFNTLKPICNLIEINEIESFMFKKSNGEQLSLF